MQPLITFIFLGLLSPLVLAAEKSNRLEELDAFWKKISLSVKEGDLASYRNSCHRDAVLVTGVKKKSYPLEQALKRWKTEFDATRDGEINATVVFRFSHRYGDKSTAHEKGMFVYSSQKPGEEWKRDYIHFEGLLVKKNGRWLMMMEYQKSVGTKEEWNKLAP